MSAVLYNVLRMVFLGLLWFFVVSIAILIRRDITGTVINDRRESVHSAKKQKKPSRSVPRSSPNPAPSMPTRLVVVDGPLAGTTFPLGASDILVDRSPDCTLVLNDTHASGHHARFFFQDGMWCIEDLGSTNGTFVNNQKIHMATSLRVGLPITVGYTKMELR
ncbi:MAG: FHA domain-containing protein [Actinomycetaceae bacterium]|nr:FHA domain-containing protein [Actinomycetaceae bacterium]